MLEKAVRNKTIAFAKKLGIQNIRLAFQGGVTVGWPDDLFLIPGGRPLFIEFKATGKKPTPRQIHKIQTLIGYGYNVEVCDSSDEACRAITQAVDTARLSEEGH